MAAISVHIVHIGHFSVAADGSILDKENPTTTIKQVTTASREHRVIPDAQVASSAGYPTPDNYIKLEAAGGYVLYHYDQYNIVTYLQSQINSA